MENIDWAPNNIRWHPISWGCGCSYLRWRFGGEHPRNSTILTVLMLLSIYVILPNLQQSKQNRDEVFFHQGGFRFLIATVTVLRSPRKQTSIISGRGHSRDCQPMHAFMFAGFSQGKNCAAFPAQEYCRNIRVYLWIMIKKSPNLFLVLLIILFELCVLHYENFIFFRCFSDLIKLLIFYFK